MDYGELLRRHVTSGADLTIAAVECPVGRAASLDVIEVDAGGRAIGFEEKPASPRSLQSSPEKALVSMGVYVFGKAALIEVLRKNADCSDSKDFARDILPVFIHSGRAAVFQFGGYWRDLGTLDVYYETNLDLLLTGAALNPYENATWPTRTLAGPKSIQRSWLASESRVSADATLAACEVWMSIVSTGARIDADAQLEAAIVLPGVHIGSGAKIRNAIIAEKAVVSPNARIGYDSAADLSQFPVSEKGIAIVGASRPDMPGAPRESIRAMKARRSIALLSRRQK